MSEPKILTVILNYRTPELTVQAAEAALAAMADMPGEIAIVDNDSGDGSFEHIAAAVAAKGWDTAGRVQVHASGHNGGFGSGNNFAIRAGLMSGDQPDYVYLCNPDAQPAPDAIRVLVDFLESHPQAGIAGSLIFRPDGKPVYGAFNFPSIIGEFEDGAATRAFSRLLGRKILYSPTPEVTTKVDWVSGSSVMFRRAMLDEVGLFDETYFLYFEETDLCLRARRAGWEAWCLPESRVTHLGGASTGMFSWDRHPSYWFDSRLHYFVKNYGRAYAATATLALLAGEVAWWLRRRLDPKAERYRNTRRFAGDLIGHTAKGLFARRPAPPAVQTSGPATKDGK